MTTCTTAAAVRREGIEPTMDAVARVHRARELLAEFQATFAATTAALSAELQALEDDARRTLGLLDEAHTYLDEAERSGDGFLALASELPNGRQIAAVINDSVDALTTDRRADGQRAARRRLHWLFDTFGAELFQQRFMHHVGKRRGVVLRREYAAWQNDNDTKEQAA
jgi:hypothetical protein